MTQLASKLPWELANPRWASILNPILALPFLNGNQVTGVDLLANVPKAINHLLGRLPQGWILTDNEANTVVWRTENFNPYTITLEASANTTISIWVF